MKQPGTITFHFHDTPFRLRQRREIRTWLHTLAQHHDQRIGELNYMFCSDAHMLIMNGQHLDHHYYTDILTFGMPSGQGLTGDILISIDRVRDNAKTHSVSPLDETHRVMAHGLLHLIGLDDSTPEHKTRMRQAEDHALSIRPFT